MMRFSFKDKWMEVGLTLLALSMLSMLLPLFGQTTSTSKLTVRVTGARNAKGTIRFALFQDATGFPENPAKALLLRQAEIDPQTLSAEVVFEDIPAGTYAVSVFHDENMNGKFDKNFVGAPKEGYGASNNPKKRIGPPLFDEAKFSVDGPDHVVEIKLNY